MTYGSVSKAVFLLTICILLIFSASGCGGKYSAKVTPVTPPSGTSTEEAAATGTGCIEVSPEKLAEIEAKLTIVGGGSLKDGWAVKSNDLENTYFIAAEIEGPGFYDNGQFGLWAVTSLEPGQGEIHSVNTRAKAHSDWPVADASITQKSDGAQEAINCVDAFQKS